MMKIARTAVLMPTMKRRARQRPACRTKLSPRASAYSKNTSEWIAAGFQRDRRTAKSSCHAARARHAYRFASNVPLFLVANPEGTPAIMKMLGYDTKGTDYCPAISHTGLLRDDGDDVYLAGCAAGTGTVEIRRESDSKLLDRYTISVGPTPTPTPTQLPTTGGSISGQTGQVGGVSPVGTTPTATVIPTPTPTPVPTSGGNR